MSAPCSALCSVLCSLERLNKLFISSSVVWLNAAFPARQIYLTKCFLLNYLLGSQRKLLFEGLFLFTIDWLMGEIHSVGNENHLQQLMMHRMYDIYLIRTYVCNSSIMIGSCLYIIYSQSISTIMYVDEGTYRFTRCYCLKVELFQFNGLLLFIGFRV